MTPHDEVKAWIDDKIEQIENEARRILITSPRNPVADWRMIPILQLSIASLLANRAGLERHKENQNKECSECFDKTGKDNYEPVSADFPCPTYTEIADPIRSVM